MKRILGWTNDLSIQTGARLRAVVDFEIVAVAYVYGAMTFGVRCRVQHGTTFLVFSVADPLLGVICAKLEDPKVEEGFVGKEDYASPHYAGLSFVFDASEVGRRLELL